MREVRNKQKKFLKAMKILVIASVAFMFLYIGFQPYIRDFNKALSVVINYACDILVIANLAVIFVYYSKYGKVEQFLKDIENELDDAGYYISSRKEKDTAQLTEAVINDLKNNGFKTSTMLDVKDFTFDARAFKGQSYFYVACIEELDKNDILAYLDEMIFDLTSNCFKRKGTAIMCFVTDKACDDAVAVSKMITPLGRKGQLKTALAIAEANSGRVYFQGNEETKAKTLISNFVMNCELPLKEEFIHKDKLPFQYELEEKVKSFTLKDYNSGSFYLH